MLIATRHDLDSIAGTDRHAQMMALLRGSMWRLERDDVAKRWVAVEDSSTIERFGFTRADFPDAIPPALPEYVAPPEPVQMSITVNRFQINAALWQTGDLEKVDAFAADPATDMLVRLAWKEASEFNSASLFATAVAEHLELTTSQMADVFRFAASITG